MPAPKSNSTPTSNVNETTAEVTYAGEQHDVTRDLKQPKQPRRRARRAVDLSVLENIPTRRKCPN
jgi:hypothetical protein